MPFRYFSNAEWCSSLDVFRGDKKVSAGRDDFLDTIQAPNFPLQRSSFASPTIGQICYFVWFLHSQKQKKRIMNCQRVSCALRWKDQQVYSNKWQKNLDQNCIRGWQALLGDLAVCLLSSLLPRLNRTAKKFRTVFIVWIVVMAWRQV